MAKASEKSKDQPKSILIDNIEVCRMLGVNADTWRKRVANGAAPKPHSRMGSRTYYRRADVAYFIREGHWPAGAKFFRRKEEATPAGPG